MGNEGDTGSAFRFEATLKPDEDPKEAETRWYRWNEEEKRWEFYGNEMPSWGESPKAPKTPSRRVRGLLCGSIQD